MTTKRGITIVRHMLPEPTEVDRGLAERQFSGEADEQSMWPTYVVDGDGHYLVLSPIDGDHRGHGNSDLINWQSGAPRFPALNPPPPKRPR